MRIVLLLLLLLFIRLFLSDLNVAYSDLQFNSTTTTTTTSFFHRSHNSHFHSHCFSILFLIPLHLLVSLFFFARFLTMDTGPWNSSSSKIKSRSPFQVRPFRTKNSQENVNPGLFISCSQKQKPLINSFLLTFFVKQLDRFIPNRSAMDFGYAHYMLTEGNKKGREKENGVVTSPSREAYQKHLAEAFNMNRTRILAFKNKPPTPVELIPKCILSPPPPSKSSKPRRHIPQVCKLNLKFCTCTDQTLEN